MIRDMGTIRPGRTLRIPFSTFDKDDGSTITMTNFSVADILIYKDGSTTERASTSGFTATTDFDAKTGKHVLIIDLADNTTADFFAAGSEYLVGIDAVTVDGVTTGGWVARFEIGYRGAILDTTIATLSSQTSFTLASGPAENDALKDMWAIIHDVASAVQLAWVQISAYTGSTKTVTLAAGATFTAAAGDNISIMGPMPLQPATTGRRLVVDANGLGDATTVKVGPSGSGTAQTARDIGSSVLLSSGTGAGQLDFTNGVVKSNWVQYLGTALGGTAAQVVAAITKFFNVASPTGTVNSLPDAVAGASGGVAIVGSVMGDSAGVTTLLSRLSAARAGYLDFLNIGGAVASQADINALNQSASRRVILQTVGQYERPESGSTVYTIEARTYDGDGAVTNADSTPTLTATGTTSGSLAANLGTASNPATGVYRWDYTVASNATIEPVRFDLSATIGAAAFPMAAYTQVVDFVSATWTTSDRTKLTAVYDKLPTNAIADETLVQAAITSATSPLATASALSTLSTTIGTPAGASLAADLAAVKTDTGNLVSRITSTLFAGITSLGDWLRRMARGDAGTAGMIAAQAEINTGGTSTFDGSTDNLQDIKDASGGGGGGGSDPLENEVPGAYGVGTAGEVLGNLQSNLVTALSGISVTISSPFSDDGETLTIVQGDDYANADGRALPVTLTGTFPDFTGATPVMRLSRTTKVATTGATVTTTVSVTGTVVTATGGTRVMRFEPTSADTSQLSGGVGTWEVEITLTNGRKMTLPVAKELIVKPELG